MKITDRVVLITGASAGIGRATAERLAERNNRIAITARRATELDEVAAVVRSKGSECLALPADALDADRARDVVTEIAAAWGRIDAALLNIGHGPAQNTASVSADEMTRVMRLNYDTFVHYFVPLVAQMKTQEGGGLIAHTNSLAGYLGLPQQGPYSAAKAAVRILMDAARIELRDHGVRLTTICPGFVAAGPGDDEGIPRPFEVTAPDAARRIVRAMEREVAETSFPLPMRMGVAAGRLLPRFVASRVLRTFAE